MRFIPKPNQQSKQKRKEKKKGLLGVVLGPAEYHRDSDDCECERQPWEVHFPPTHVVAKPRKPYCEYEYSDEQLAIA